MVQEALVTENANVSALENPYGGSLGIIVGILKLVDICILRNRQGFMTTSYGL